MVMFSTPRQKFSVALPSFQAALTYRPLAGDDRLCRALAQADDLGVEADRERHVVRAGLEHQLIALRAELVRLLRVVDRVDVVLDRRGRHRRGEHVDVRAEVRGAARRRRGAGRRRRQRPLLVGAVRAGPDLHLGARAAEAGVVQALAGVRVDQLAVGLRLPDLRGGAVAGVEVDQRAVGGAGGGHVQALAEDLQGCRSPRRSTAARSCRCRCRPGSGFRRGAGAAVVQAQALVTGDRAGRADRGRRGLRAGRGAPKARHGDPLRSR
jgi:hypothetical protein